MIFKTTHVNLVSEMKGSTLWVKLGVALIFSVTLCALIFSYSAKIQSMLKCGTKRYERDSRLLTNATLLPYSLNF